MRVKSFKNDLFHLSLISKWCCGGFTAKLLFGEYMLENAFCEILTYYILRAVRFIVQLVILLSLKSCPYNRNYLYKKQISYSVGIKLYLTMSISVGKVPEEDSV